MRKGLPGARSAQANQLRRFVRGPIAIVFLALLALMVLMAFVGPLIGRNPIAADFPTMQPPSLEFPMGTDDVGRDYLSRVLYGGQASLLVGFSVGLLCMTIALILGGLAGYFGGVIDTVLVKISEFFQALPGLVIVLVTAAMLGSNLGLVIIILSVTMWPGVARIVRAEAMRIAQLGYVESARATGTSGLRILWSEVIPNAMPPVLVATTMMIGRAILIESGLAYLGIGDVSRPSWGALLNTAQAHITGGWWLALFPGLCIVIVVLAINMIGDALNDAYNPSIGKVKVR
ncbi:MAG: ABC transporter permease [Pseudoclavibacter sp.]